METRTCTLYNRGLVPVLGIETNLNRIWINIIGTPYVPVHQGTCIGYKDEDLRQGTNNSYTDDHLNQGTIMSATIEPPHQEKYRDNAKKRIDSETEP